MKKILTVLWLLIVAVGTITYLQATEPDETISEQISINEKEVQLMKKQKEELQKNYEKKVWYGRCLDENVVLEAR